MYCTRADIEANRIPRVHLLDLVDDERIGEFDDSTGAVPFVGNTMSLWSDQSSNINIRIKECIEAAVNIIDSFLAERYTVPIPNSSLPPLINTICLDIAVFRLYLRRNAVPEADMQAKNDAMKLLERIQARKLMLPLPENVSIATTILSPVAIRTREKLLW
jgi:phage gp36-like protein